MAIKYKLTILTSCLILFFFIGYSVMQYGLVTKWIQQTERDALQKTIDEVSGYLMEQETENDQGDWATHRQFFEKLVRQDQLFRLLDVQGREFLVISNGIPEQWISPASAKTVQFTSFYHGQEHLLLIRSPIRAPSFSGTIELASNMETTDTLIERLNTLIAVCAIAGTVISAFGGLFVAGQMVRPIQRMTDTMNKIKRQGLHERIPYKDNGDELSHLIRMFNGMMDELERSFVRQRKFIEDASHEFRTPIAIIEGHLKLIRRWGKHQADVLEESLNAALQETERLKTLANQMLVLQNGSRHDPIATIAPIRVADVISSVIRNYRVLYPHYNFHVHLMPDIEIRVLRDHLEQMLIIVLDNAVRYSGEDQPIEIHARKVEDQVSIQVVDHGSGIPEEDLPFIFDRFYRVDKSRSRKLGGNGLGLSIAKELAEAYSGSVQISSREGQGTVVTYTFPTGS